MTTPDGIRYETIADPAFTMLKIYLGQGQSVVAEKGAMMYMSRTVEIQTHKRAGFFKSLKVAAFGGESFLVNTFTATHGHGELALVGPGMGDIKSVNLTGGGLIIQSGSYLASTPTVNIDTSWQGFKGLFAESDIIMLRATGTGTVWLTSFGGLVERPLQAGETICVDNGHLVAWPDNMPYNIRKVGGIKSTLLSGEGLVVDFTGPGILYLQTRHLPAFAKWLAPFIGKR
jgi:uncharacterized protein (TIGR00266 family)